MGSAVRGHHGGDAEHIPLAIHGLGHLVGCEALPLVRGDHHPPTLAVHTNGHIIIRLAVMGDSRHGKKVHGHAVHEIRWDGSGLQMDAIRGPGRVAGLAHLTGLLNALSASLGGRRVREAVPPAQLRPEPREAGVA